MSYKTSDFPRFLFWFIAFEIAEEITYQTSISYMFSLLLSYFIFSNSLLSLPIRKPLATLGLPTFPIRFIGSLWRKALNLLLWWSVRKCFIVFFTTISCLSRAWNWSEYCFYYCKALANIRKLFWTVAFNFLL